MSAESAAAVRHGFVLCESCSLLHRAPDGLAQPACARCGARLHARKPASLARTAAFLAAAAILYVPANVFPVMESGSLFLSQSDTILSGAVYLYRTGQWLLALIVFVASIVIPLAKIASLAYLSWTAHRRSTRRLEQRARLYRVTHWIGRWSMVDIYVGAVLVGLVQFKAFGSIVPGPGAVFFGAVVVLTMLASLSFDPRLMWDPVDEAHG
jgi:paraquat-inducible protein A